MAAVGRVELATVEAIAHMPRCRDCRWWELWQEDAYWGICTLLSKQRHEKALAYTDLDDFMTAPDFGCVQFEARG